ncbi:MAG: cytochrome c oxidase subunit 3 family protein, partial [Rhodospirillales bacterium]
MNQDTKDDTDWGALSALPGNPMIWILIISELVVFGAGLTGFMTMRILEPGIFAAGQATLDYWLGGLNTMFLITSGLCAALAVLARSAGTRFRVRLWLGGAGLLGAGFLAVKLIEWNGKLSQGHN